MRDYLVFWDFFMFNNAIQNLNLLLNSLLYNKKPMSITKSLKAILEIHLRVFFIFCNILNLFYCKRTKNDKFAWFEILLKHNN